VDSVQRTGPRQPGTQGPVAEPINPDVDLRADRLDRWAASGPAVIAAVSAGGVIGAEARYAAGLIWPTARDAFPYTTFAVNVIGCALIGTTIVCLCRMRVVSKLARPFLATGILGGFTTFSTAAVDSQQLATSGHLLLAAANILGTAGAGLTAVLLTARLTRRVADTYESGLNR
jgi:fluoride exporter